MMKRILLGCSLVLLLLVGALPAHAQTPSAPQAAPAASKPSQEELKKFASAIKQMLLIAQETDNQIAQVVQKSGMSETRLREIYLSKTDPNSKLQKPVTSQEQQIYDQTLARMTEIEKDARAKMDKTIVAQGLQVDRFNQIFSAIQQDPELRKQVRSLIEAN